MNRPISRVAARRNPTCPKWPQDVLGSAMPFPRARIQPSRPSRHADATETWPQPAALAPSALTSTPVPSGSCCAVGSAASAATSADNRLKRAATNSRPTAVGAGVIPMLAAGPAPTASASFGGPGGRGPSVATFGASGIAGVGLVCALAVGGDCPAFDAAALDELQLQRDGECDVRRDLATVAASRQKIPLADLPTVRLCPDDPAVET